MTTVANLYALRLEHQIGGGLDADGEDASDRIADEVVHSDLREVLRRPPVLDHTGGEEKTS